MRIELAPHGVLGRHEAVGDQLFLVVAGDGTVSGDNQADTRIHAGMAACWSAGEMHETRAGEHGLVALVLEGQFTLGVEKQAG
ncbi:MAG: hypothetical protein AB7N24_16870 [Dehalococcoidia bacterium]